MVLFLALAALLWAVGHLIRAPYSARWLMIGLLYVAVLAVQVAFPEGHPLRSTLGGSLPEWLMLGALAGAVWAYSLGLRHLRSRVRPENRPAVADPDKMGEAELVRASRHILLREIGGAGQARLKSARVLVVGAGGLGAPCLMYLGAAGVGTLGVIDDDVVETSNLQRQVIHTDDRVGMPKVFSADAALRAQNPHLQVRPYHRRLTPEIAETLFADYDIIVDGTDDAATRYAVNAAAIATRRPLVSGALGQWEGQLTTFAPAEGTPCYRCLFPEPAADGLAPSCAEAGVFSPLPGMVGTMMAAEVLKEITGAGTGLRGRLLLIDALWGETRTISITRRADCPDCGAQACAPVVSAP